MTELSNGHKHYSSPQTLKTKMSEENEEYYQVVCIKEEVIEDDWSENDTTNMQLTESGYVSSNQDGNLSVESTNQSIGTLHQKGIETTHDSSRETVLKGGQRDSFDDGNCSLESTVRNARLPQQHLGERGSKDEQGQLIDDGNCSLDSTKLKTRLLHQNLGERELKDEQRQLLDDGNCSLDSTNPNTRLLHQHLGERELKDEQRQLLDDFENGVKNHDCSLLSGCLGCGSKCFSPGR
ncbi:uncharacterized protein LOC100891208 isoform X6 [Strongylocentrotus purpuratus]|uniref:Uncharacterized protein n=1 Tax=Strongylocentrotus purpuratus TaxID=7668 RepID=A0A7M7N9K4_STRPU|nr:uncharacterized protein LOC100891208 isoform X6 [Strongylocentrotus purpuratus]